jgi:hypothetical protein
MCFSGIDYILCFFYYVFFLVVVVCDQYITYSLHAQFVVLGLVFSLGLGLGLGLCLGLGMTFGFGLCFCLCKGFCIFDWVGV